MKIAGPVAQNLDSVVHEIVIFQTCKKIGYISIMIMKLCGSRTIIVFQ